MSPLAKSTLLVAGRGSLPLQLKSAAKGPVCLVAIEGAADAETAAQSDHVLPLGRLGAMIEAGLAAGATQVAFIGGLDRPGQGQVVFDAYTQAHMDMSALIKGDDAALRAVAAMFEGAGLTLVGATEFAPELAMPAAKTFGSADPDAATDGARGLEVALTLGQLDVGQAVVVQHGLVLAVEGIEGTDALIARSAALARPGRGPVLVKTAKPQQDLRLDMPTFGPTTLEAMAQAGFAGAFLEVGRTLVVGQDTLDAHARELGVFVTGIAA